MNEQIPISEPLQSPDSGITDDDSLAAARNILGETLNQSPSDESEEYNADILTKAEWHKDLEKAVHEAKENRTELTVLFIDFDRFKGVNDELGHDEGDQVIAAFKKILTTSVRTNQNDRPNDTLANSTTSLPSLPNDVESEFINPTGGRVGGDEFAVHCQTDANGAEVIKQRINATLHAFLDQPENSKIKELGFGLSIGSNTLTGDMTASELLKGADDAMYIEKFNHLPVFNEEQTEIFNNILEQLHHLNVRPRDIMKYIELEKILNSAEE